MAGSNQRVALAAARRRATEGVNTDSYNCYIHDRFSGLEIIVTPTLVQWRAVTQATGWKKKLTISSPFGSVRQVSKITSISMPTCSFCGSFSVSRPSTLTPPGSSR